MAYVLSLRPHSPLKRSFSDNPYLQSCSPVKEPLLNPLSDITVRNTSACSLYSLGSNRVGSWAHGNENTPPLGSQSLLNLVPKNDHSALAVRPIDGSRKPGRAVGRPPFPSRVTAPSNPYSRKTREAHRVPELSTSSSSSDEVTKPDDKSDLLELYEAVHPLPAGRSSDNTHSEPHGAPDETAPAEAISSQPFRRWLSTLRRRHMQRRDDHASASARVSLDLDRQERDIFLRPPHPEDSLRRNSESMSSSMGGVITIKSASMTIGSTSIAPRSENGFLGEGRTGNRTSHYSDARRSLDRGSLDSHRGPLGPVIDESAWLRSLQRRKIVEELIASEEGYISDLKVLINVSWYDARATHDADLT
jgi:hypothetical protein